MAIYDALDSRINSGVYTCHSFIPIYCSANYNLPSTERSEGLPECDALPNCCHQGNTPTPPQCRGTVWSWFLVRWYGPQTTAYANRTVVLVIDYYAVSKL